MLADLDAAVVEQSPLHVLDPVHTIGRDDLVVSDGNPAIRIEVSGNTSVDVVALDRVVSAVSTELNNVNVSGAAAVLDLTPDAELAGQDFTAEQLLLNLCEPADEIGRSPGGSHLDLHIQEAVTLDQIIAGAALDQVAAAAADQDFTRAEANGASLINASQECLQAIDQVDIRVKQDVINTCCSAGTANVVVVSRTRDGLSELIFVHRGAWGTGSQRNNQCPNIHIGIDAVGIILMGCPVEAELAKELIGAEATHHHVVASFGVMISVTPGVIGHVVTNDRAVNTALGGNALNDVAVVAQQQTVFQTGLEPVVTLSTKNRFNTGTTISEVVALAEQELLII